MNSLQNRLVDQKRGMRTMASGRQEHAARKNTVDHSARAASVRRDRAAAAECRRDGVCAHTDAKIDGRAREQRGALTAAAAS